MQQVQRMREYVEKKRGSGARKDIKGLGCQACQCPRIIRLWCGPYQQIGAIRGRRVMQLNSSGEVQQENKDQIWVSNFEVNNPQPLFQFTYIGLDQ